MPQIALGLQCKRTHAEGVPLRAQDAVLARLAPMHREIITP